MGGDLILTERLYKIVKENIDPGIKRGFEVFTYLSSEMAPESGTNQHSSEK